MSLGFPLQDNIVIWLYDALGNRYMALTEVYEPMIEHSWQGVHDLTFTIRGDDPRSQYLLPDQLIEYPAGEFWINANYKDTNEGPLRTIKAKRRWHNLTWRTKNGVRSILGKTPEEGMETILSGSGWSLGSAPVDATVYTYEDIDPTVLEFLRGWASVTGYGLEFDTENLEVSLVEIEGEERDLGFFYGSNMESVSREFVPPQVTRMYPYGANNLDISAVNPTGLNYIENYDWYVANFGLTVSQARNLYRKDWTWKDDRFFTAIPLFDAAVAYLEQLSLPQISYSGRVIDFSRLTTIAVDDCQAGDIVRVTDEVLNYTAKTRVTRTVRYPMSPDKDEIELELFTNNGLNILNEERTIDYDQLQLIVNANDSAIAVTSSATLTNQISVTTSGSSTVVASGHIVGQASGAGTVQFQFQVDGQDFGEPVVKEFSDLEQIEHSWVTFADSLTEGAHNLNWIVTVTEVTSGAGEILVDLGDARAVVWLSGGLGVGVDLSPNQYIIEVLPLISEMAWGTISVGTDAYTVEITDSDDVEDYNSTMSESLATVADVDFDAGQGMPDDYTEDYVVDFEFALGVWYAADTPETYVSDTDISDDVPGGSLEDDLVVVFLMHRSGATNITAPSGFTRVAQVSVDDGSVEQWSEVWTKTDDGTMADTTLTFTGTVTDRMGMKIAIIRNAEGGTVDLDSVETATYVASTTDPGVERFDDPGSSGAAKLAIFFGACAYAETSPTVTTYGIDYALPVNTVAPVASSADSNDISADVDTTDGTWVGASTIAYLWKYDDDDTPLPGTNDEATYTPAEGDWDVLAGEGIYCTVTATNAAGSTGVDSNTVTLPGIVRATGGTIVTNTTSLIEHEFSAGGTFSLILPGILPVTITITGTATFGSLSASGSTYVDPEDVTVTVTSGTLTVAYDPADFVGNFAAWYDSGDTSTITDSSGDVTEWADRSGNGLNLVTASGTPRTGDTTHNGRNVIDVVGGEFFKASTASDWAFLHDGTIHRIFMVANVSGPDGNLITMLNTGNWASAVLGTTVGIDDRYASDHMRHMVTRGVSGQFPINHVSGNNESPMNQMNLTDIKSDPSNGTASARSTIRTNDGSDVNNNTDSQSVVSSDPPYALCVGARDAGDFYMEGSWAALLFADRELTTAEESTVRGYISERWNYA